MKVQSDAILTCSACAVEAPHELLYLLGHLAASRCLNCGTRAVYSERLYEEYVRDVFERTGHLPEKLATEAFQRPLGLVLWPVKAARKPILLAREFGRLSDFSHARRP